jgi:hypothetical protein
MLLPNFVNRIKRHYNKYEVNYGSIVFKHYRNQLIWSLTDIALFLE